jgi:hypothetical protein
LCNNRLWAGWLGFDSLQRQEIFVFSTPSRLALRPTQPPIQWVLEAVLQRIKQPGHEAHHSPVLSAMVKNGGAIPPHPHTSPWYDALLIIHRANITVTFSSREIKKCSEACANK